jgi:anti-sigma regulatory factor (Ser/Thr protein kinase)
VASIGDVLRLELSCDADAPRKARAVMRAMHDGDWSLEDGLLVSSELVTNAVLHSACTSTDRLEVQVHRGEGSLVISVHDPGRTQDAAEPVMTEQCGRGGLGLLLVERLSLRWGSDRPDGYRVWAELAA